ncbi:hypothetical protein CLV78_10380 [Aliiruegeria haliotis]|uniref:Uncharacterized protein n=1 Tax=Aliiruegeria haliotis TaxID=1280846 RepID=A0A2T0RSQ0_9RHOB|nr:hypothetical protein CLV78_10380 [Aliiruegeria haliotis]
MDLVVADLVKPHRRPALATPEFRHKMVQALPRPGRDWAPTQRADRIVLRQVHGWKSGQRQQVQHDAPDRKQEQGPTWVQSLLKPW